MFPVSRIQNITNMVDLVPFDKPMDNNGNALFHNGDESEFQQKLKQLKHASTHKFRTKWEEILDKYSQIDDEKDSDEIDLLTGEIITDNGHLRGIRSNTEYFDDVALDGNIWAPSYDADRVRRLREIQDARKKLKKHKLKTKLKENNMFYNSRSDVTDIHKIEELRDNLLLLTPSPTKKHKSLSPGDLTPVKFNSSPIKRNYSPISLSPIRRSWAKQKENEKYDNVEIERTYLSGEEAPRAEVEQQSDVDSEDDSEGSVSEVSENGQALEHYRKEWRSRLHKRKLHNNESDESLFEDEYSLILDPFYEPELPIYNCAFECSYCTGNKLLYKNHLLQKHATQLKSVGYPIEITCVNVIVPESIVTTLDSQFPLVCRTPAETPITCTKLSNGSICQRVFMTPEHLHNHTCSSKIQVYMCPILGCEFMTDGGYYEWRDHIIDQQHHIHPKLRIVAKKPALTTKNHNFFIKSDTPVLAQTSIIIDDEGYDSIDELFDT